MKHGPLKLICPYLVALMLLSMAASAFAEDYKGAYFVNDFGGRGRLNVHLNPSKDDVIDHLEQGTVVQYHNSDDGWLYVEWWSGNDDHGYGYVDPSFLTSIVSDATDKYSIVCNVYVHNDSKIEQGQCARYHTGVKLEEGQRVTVSRQDGTWAYVDFGSDKGWVPSIYLKKIG